MYTSLPIRISQIIPMALQGISYLKEVTDFNIGVYVPHIGSLRSPIRSIKVYTRSGSRNYFVHDEQTDRLFEYMSRAPINTDSEYDQLVRTYVRENMNK